MTSRILPLVALLVAFGIFFAYVNPTWSGSIADAKVKIADNDSALAAAAEYMKKQNALATARDDIAPADLTRLETFLPDSVNNVGLILDLNALAARAGLSFASVDVLASTVGSASDSPAQQATLPAGPIGSVDLSLSAVGTYSALQTFLLGVERSARLLDVREIIVKGSDTGVYTYQMTLRLYWLR